MQLVNTIISQGIGLGYTLRYKAKIGEKDIQNP